MANEVPEDILHLDNLKPRVEQTSPATGEAARPMPPDTASEELARLKLKRLADYIADSLAHPDSEVAMLGATNAILMTALMRLSDQIEKVLQADSSNVSQLDLLMHGIVMMLKLTRQVDRFSQLKLYISESQSALEDNTRSRKYLQ